LKQRSLRCGADQSIQMKDLGNLLEHNVTLLW
jgi:hypothetical protein